MSHLLLRGSAHGHVLPTPARAAFCATLTRHLCPPGASVRPPNPVEFLATFLLQNNPQKDGAAP